ncbi:MAG TPA: tetratricopeptide repeat protein [Vicinamibacterales bacterium]|nr:tetratricopeptide repeat protein [Vicinamibacterales bacterium]
MNFGPLEPGTGFGGRYHVIRLLGMGGMGAVYQAWDDELGEAVAIKVIRPEITDDPGAARDIERRFKRELVTARQVTHRNVVRIHDLGDIDGIKYITMPYINGSDLATILKREGRLSVRRSLAIARQVVAGLRAAHESGVVHRDLKPANVMIDPDGNAVIMDFGIARSTSGAGATVAGAVVGTLEYMAPEQAMAQPVDHRADIYSFGLIVYDMLIGRRDSSRAESAVAELMKRISQPLPPIRTRDDSIPEALDDIISRCLVPDPAGRFQTTAALEAALAALDADGVPATGTAAGTQPLTRPFPLPAPPAAAPAPGRRPLPWRWVAVGLAALAAIVVGAIVMLPRGSSPRTGTAESASAKPLSLAILPFRNATGTAGLDGLGPTLAEMIRAEVGQSAHLRLVASERIFQTLRDLRIGADADLDVDSIRKLADFSSATTVVIGRFVKLGEQIRIEASLHDGQREPVVLTASAAGENDLMKAAQQLGRSIRESLALAPAAVKELEANPFKPSSQSIQALRMYSEGLEYSRQGEHIEALKRFEESTKVDPGFALAFSRLGQTLATLGRGNEAESASRQAVSLSQNLPAEEKDLIAATHATIIKDVDKAIESYQRLVQMRPADAQLHFELAKLHESKGAFDQARDEYAKVLETDAKYVDALLAAGRVEIQRGAFQDSLGYLNKALTFSVQLDKRQATANVLQALGIAYKNLGKLDDALRQYKESLAIKREIKDQRGVASSLGEIAHIHDRQGRPDEAVASYKEALEIRRSIGDQPGVGLTLINLGASYIDRGKYDEALTTLKEALQIERALGDDSQLARCLSNIGNIYLATGQYEDARTNLERALELRERLKNNGNIALTLTSLADVSTRLGDYGKAEKHYLRAIELWRSAGNKRGAAVGTFGMANVFEAQGRYGAALDARAEALKTLRDLGERSTLLAEILAGYGYALALTMKTADARKALDEALALAQESKSRTLVAQTLNYQGDNAYFTGDLKGARALYEQAQTAARSADRYQLLRARVNLAKVAVEDGRAPAAAVELRQLTKEAEDLGLKYLASETSLHLGAALLKANNAAQAKAALDTGMTRSERIGARALQANGAYLMGEAVRRSDKAGDASSHYRQALQVLDELQKEARTDSLSTRFDLRAVREQSARWVDMAKK